MPEAADFIGRWTVSRQITDRLGPDGHFSGEAVFSEAGDHLIYSEAGELRLGAAVMRAERRYLWFYGPARIEVCFADGRAFHSFPLSGGAGSDHPCGPDLYRVTYDFAGFPSWSACWEVTGPRKDYVMVSAYHSAGTA